MIVDDDDTDAVNEYVVKNKFETHVYVEHSMIGMIGSHALHKSVNMVDYDGRVENEGG